MVSQLVNKYSAVFEQPLNAVFVKVFFVDQFAARKYWQKFAWLVAVVFVFDDVCYVFEHKYILAHNGLSVNSIMALYPCMLDTQKYGYGKL